MLFQPLCFTSFPTVLLQFANKGKSAGGVVRREEQGKELAEQDRGRVGGRKGSRIGSAIELLQAQVTCSTPCSLTPGEEINVSLHVGLPLNKGCIRLPFSCVL